VAGTEFLAQVLHSQLQKGAGVPQGPAGPTDTTDTTDTRAYARLVRTTTRTFRNRKPTIREWPPSRRSRYRLRRRKSHTTTPSKSGPTPGARSRGASRNSNKSSSYSTHTTIPTSPWDIKKPKLPRNIFWIPVFRISSLQISDNSWTIARHT